VNTCLNEAIRPSTSHESVEHTKATEPSTKALSIYIIDHLNQSRRSGESFSVYSNFIRLVVIISCFYAAKKELCSLIDT
jgi:hypothetical protein